MSKGTLNPKSIPWINVAKKGSWGWRIIRSFVKDGRRYELHATKGWRSYRV